MLLLTVSITKINNSLKRKLEVQKLTGGVILKETKIASWIPINRREDASINVIEFPQKRIYHLFKRFTDVVCSVLGIILLFVPLGVISIIILIDSPGASPIYSQKRVGKNGKEFKIYKLRSMIPNADKQIDLLLDKNEMNGPAFKIKDDPRITKVGRFIRRTSIDEFPQLFNVLKGDMSLVGPRPPLPREVAQYSEQQRKRLSVTPGLTCFWQVQPKRNNLSFDEWLELDLKYIQECSFKTDLLILIKTIGAVFNGEGE